jgi:hypothetical protein
MPLRFCADAFRKSFIARTLAIGYLPINPGYYRIEEGNFIYAPGDVRSYYISIEPLSISARPRPVLRRDVIGECANPTVKVADLIEFPRHNPGVVFGVDVEPVEIRIAKSPLGFDAVLIGDEFEHAVKVRHALGRAVVGQDMSTPAGVRGGNRAGSVGVIHKVIETVLGYLHHR